MTNTYVVEETEEKMEYKPIRPRRIPWTQRRREVERKYRSEKVDIKPKLTEGEEIFEKELNNASKVS